MEPRVKLYIPREESFPIPLKYIDVTRNTHASQGCIVGENIDDYWNVDGDRELSDTWMVRVETVKRTNDLQARHFVARDLERHVRCVETQRRANVGYLETKGRQCQTIAWYLLHGS